MCTIIPAVKGILEQRILWSRIEVTRQNMVILIQYHINSSQPYVMASPLLTSNKKVKGGVPVHAMNAYKGYSPLILNLGTTWRWVQPRAPAALPT
jgi:hypothetical protein